MKMLSLELLICMRDMFDTIRTEEGASKNKRY